MSPPPPPPPGPPSVSYDYPLPHKRDESACVTLQRVPKAGGKDGELEDYWLKYYHLAEGEKEFPVRNRQVRQ